MASKGQREMPPKDLKVVLQFQFILLSTNKIVLQFQFILLSTNKIVLRPLNLLKKKCC